MRQLDARCGKGPLAEGTEAVADAESAFHVPIVATTFLGNSKFASWLVIAVKLSSSIIQNGGHGWPVMPVRCQLFCLWLTRHSGAPTSPRPSTRRCCPTVL